MRRLSEFYDQAAVSCLGSCTPHQGLLGAILFAPAEFQSCDSFINTGNSEEGHQTNVGALWVHQQLHVGAQIGVEKEGSDRSWTLTCQP